MLHLSNYYRLCVIVTIGGKTSWIYFHTYSLIHKTQLGENLHLLSHRWSRRKYSEHFITQSKRKDVSKYLFSTRYSILLYISLFELCSQTESGTIKGSQLPSILTAALWALICCLDGWRCCCAGPPSLEALRFFCMHVRQQRSRENRVALMVDLMVC